MTSSSDELARALRRVCLDAAPSPDDLARLGAGRWTLYRELVRNRIEATLAEALPRTRAAADGRFEGWVARWLTESPPDTRYVRELMPRFVRWLDAAELSHEGLHPCFDDLLRYEVALHAVSLAPDPPAESLRASAFAMDRAALFHPVLQRLDLRWPVHASHCERLATAVPSPAHVLLYRDAAGFNAETLTLSPVAARVIDAMREGLEVTAAVQHSLTAEGLHPSDAFLESLAELLGGLMERGVLLGAKP